MCFASVSANPLEWSMSSPSTEKGAGTNPCHASLACGYNQKPLGIMGHAHSQSKSDQISQVHCFLHLGIERQPSSREHPKEATSVMMKETRIFPWIMSRKGGRYSCEDPQLIPGSKECFCTGIYLSSSTTFASPPAHSK